MSLEARERRYAPPTITCIICKAFDPPPGFIQDYALRDFPLSSSPKGEIGHKGPDGNPGRDGARVSLRF